MDKAIKERIDALLYELRSWDVHEQRSTVQELAEKFQLTTFVIHRIANAEGIKVLIGDIPGKDGEMADPNAETRPIEADEAAETRPEMVVEVKSPPEVDEEAETDVYEKPDLSD